MAFTTKRVSGVRIRAALNLACATWIFGAEPRLGAEATFFAERVAPVLERHCAACHGPEKQKAGLRLDTHAHALRGGEGGEVIKPGSVQESELFRRITLPESDDDVMPADGKPLLSREEIKVLELWIARGASATRSVADFPDAPAPKPGRSAPPPLAPDWRPHAATIAALEHQLGLKLVPRSHVATDGLILRTASAPRQCDDAALAKLAPVAALIVDAELARTRISDAGMRALAACENLRSIDLTRTRITSDGLAALRGLKHLEVLNLTETPVDDRGVAGLKALPTLKRVWLFGTKVTGAGARDGGAAGSQP